MAEIVGKDCASASRNNVEFLCHFLKEIETEWKEGEIDEHM
jgi:hypothetical protein